jgi:phage shock protein A
MLNDKIEEAKRKKNVLVARKKRAEAQKSIQETMHGLKDQSAFETFDRMSAKIDQLEAEAEAGAEVQEEYSGDVLASQFSKLERVAGADDDLAMLKRKMGLAPPEEAPPAKTEHKARVEAPAANAPAEAPASQAEQDELAAALEELEAEQRQEQKKAAR